ncbi:MAG TPA: dienelactone hydrolase family protein [Xanthobacteraceae bacterium]|nr:dienelactone hydrolase family protein [Xanthobacteraceae bacterium]
MANMSTPVAMTVAAIVIAWLGAQAEAQSVARIEVQPIQTITLKTAQMLTGETNGAPTTVAGELRIPKPGSDRLPAVILIHGSGGVGSNVDAWAKEINALGIAAFILDAFSGRGIVSTVNDQSPLDSLAITIDAYRALSLLAQHPRIDPARIAVMGFSKGAVPAIYSSNERFRKLYGAGKAEFAAHIGLYTPCNVQYRDDDKVTAAPIRLFHGIADDYVSIAPCRDYVERLKRAGANVALAEYPDAFHAYDVTLYASPIQLPQAQTTRNCILREGDKGQLLNAKTGATYTLDDPCVEHGPHIGFNRAAYEATVKAVREFLAATFKLSS